MERDINQAFRKIEEKLRQAIIMSMQKLSLYAESELSMVFKTEGESANVYWSPLKESYLKQKIKKGYSEKKLHKTTTLAQSFTSKINGMTAQVGTPVKYAIYHEFGTKHIPARPFMKPVVDKIIQEGIPGKIFKEVFNAS